jgi:hypothetical protein
MARISDGGQTARSMFAFRLMSEIPARKRMDFDGAGNRRQTSLV